MKNFTACLLFALGILAVSHTLVSCSNKRAAATPDYSAFASADPVEPDTHVWYAFTKDGFERIALPANAPTFPFRPWTQAPRVADTLSGTESGYLLVNRRGLVVLSPENAPALHSDARLFASATADSLLLKDGHPIFKLYKNTMFEERVDSSAQSAASLPVVVEYQPENRLFYPVLQKKDLHLDEAAQVTSMYRFKDRWVFSAKTTTQERTDFSYFAVPVAGGMDMLFMNASTGEDSEAKRIGQDEYQAALLPKPFSVMPDRLKELLSVIPTTYPLIVKARSADSQNVYSPVTYTRNPATEAAGNGTTADTEQDALEAGALLTDTCTLAVFADGTCYFSGALPKLHIINDGKPLYFKLPVLPSGMAYTEFALCGSKLYCGWEETEFYNIGKAGFIQVDLRKVLYGEAQ